MALIKGHRGRHIRCGFALQLVTVRYPGCFLADPLEVPNEVLDVVAAHAARRFDGGQQFGAL